MSADVHAEHVTAPVTTNERKKDKKNDKQRKRMKIEARTLAFEGKFSEISEQRFGPDAVKWKEQLMELVRQKIPE